MVVRADVVEVADVRMVEGGDRAGFALEALAPLLVAGQLFRQDFDGNQAIEPGVARLIDLAHAAGADQPDDFVGAEARTGASDMCTVVRGVFGGSASGKVQRGRLRKTDAGEGASLPSHVDGSAGHRSKRHRRVAVSNHLHLVAQCEYARGALALKPAWVLTVTAVGF